MKCFFATEAGVPGSQRRAVGSTQFGASVRSSTVKIHSSSFVIIAKLSCSRSIGSDQRLASLMMFIGVGLAS